MDKLSAFMDGELDEYGARGELARLKEQPDLQQLWTAYHLIGDVMRGERMLSSRFNQGLASRLAEEPTVLAPQRRPAKRIVTYALSAAASLSAVAMVAWVALSTSNVTTVVQPQIATAPAATPALPAVPQVVSLPSDGRLNEYFLAHQGFSPSTAIQGVTPYIRSVAARQPAKTR
jgi:sigma-E factor negative regulatory protein RseA